MMRIPVILTLVILQGLVSSGCIPHGTAFMSDPAKTWISGAPEELNYQEWERILERLEELHNRRVTLEDMSPAELREIPLMSDRTVRAILTYRDSNETIKSIDVLADSLGMTDIERDVLKWVAVPERSKPSPPLGKTNFSVTQRTERAWDSNTSNSPGTGSPIKSIWKLKARNSGVVATATLAKDAFEPLIWDPGRQWYAYDHFVASLEWAGKDDRTRITAGNFLVETGQGLLFSLPFASRLSTSEPARTVRKKTRVRPYSSTLSTPVFRGLAIEQKMGNWGKLLLFGSQTKLNARRNSDVSSMLHSSASDSSFFTLVTSGLHRTESQRRTRKGVSAKTFGLVTEFRSPRMGLGAAFMRQSFGSPVLLTGARSTISSGSEGSLWGLFDSRIFRGGAEISSSNYSGIRWLVGANLKLGRRFEFGAHIRRYPGGISGLYASAPGLRPGLGNQMGVFLLGKIRFTPRLSVSVSHDTANGYLSNRNISWRVRRRDARLQLLYQPQVPIRIDIQLRNLSDPYLSSTRRFAGPTQTVLISRSVRTMKGVLRVAPTRESQISAAVIRTKSYTRTQSSPIGNLFYLEMMSPVFASIKIRIRQTFYDVPVSAVRIYAFEWDVRGKLTVPVFSGVGERSSVYIHGQISPKWNIEINYVRLRRIPVSEIGDFDPEFDRKQSITLQIRKIL